MSLSHRGYRVYVDAVTVEITSETPSYTTLTYTFHTDIPQ